MISIGIDCGSAACKGVLMKEGCIIKRCVLPTGWSPRETSEKILHELLEDELLEKMALSRENIAIASTGYGRMGVEAAGRSITEITCHGLGADYLLPGVRTVIDIGGQDSKVISVHNGKVTDFQMNDKCAAGTGRFLEMSAIRLGIDLSEFESFLAERKSCSINSMCAVFADSEIVSLLACGKSRQEIAGGIINSVASRAVSLCGRLNIQEPVLLTGGLSRLNGFREILSEQLGLPAATSPDARFAGAIGAAILAGEQ